MDIICAIKGHNINEPSIHHSPLDALPTDVQAHILTFLTHADCERMTTINQHWRHLLEAPQGAGRHVWKTLLEHRFPFLQSNDHWTVSDNDIHLRTALRHAPSTVPTAVSGGRLPRHVRTLTPHAVQFTGRVGRGDRSCRANQPLPRPQFFNRIKNVPRPQRFWRRKARQPHRLRPFCVPTRVVAQGPHHHHHHHYSLTPRTVAYFEVNIHAATDFLAHASPDDDNNNKRTPPPPRQRPLSRSPDCVAVGLSTYRFALDRRLPGWDDLSFGYHSDDGSFFHDSSQGVRYGPTFGVGDVVGCGLDYAARRVFFTHNGVFLGYAPGKDTWPQDNNDWFPTVGLDTDAVVQFNFGQDAPFAFDLESMVAASTTS